MGRLWNRPPPETLRCVDRQIQGTESWPFSLHRFSIGVSVERIERIVTASVDTYSASRHPGNNSTANCQHARTRRLCSSESQCASDGIPDSSVYLAGNICGKYIHRLKRLFGERVESSYINCTPTPRRCAWQLRRCRCPRMDWPRCSPSSRACCRCSTEAR